jgi:hypothetical protein
MKRRVSGKPHKREPRKVGRGMKGIAEHGLGAAHRLHELHRLRRVCP